MQNILKRNGLYGSGQSSFILVLVFYNKEVCEINNHVRVSAFPNKNFEPVDTRVCRT
jgi:hypothetical protein